MCILLGRADSFEINLILNAAETWLMSWREYRAVRRLNEVRQARWHRKSLCIIFSESLCFLAITTMSVCGPIFHPNFFFWACHSWQKYLTMKYIFYAKYFFSIYFLQIPESSVFCAAHQAGTFFLVFFKGRDTTWAVTENTDFFFCLTEKTDFFWLKKDEEEEKVKFWALDEVSLIALDSLKLLMYSSQRHTRPNIS